MPLANIENIAPNNLTKPSPQDRARFGFTKRNSQVSTTCAPSKVQQEVTREPEEEQSTLQPVHVCPAEDGHCVQADDMIASVALVPLLESTLGDPDAHLPLLRRKSEANRYDFKSRLAELTQQNQTLRRALADNVENQKSLYESMAIAEADIKWRLHDAACQAAGAKQQLDERGKLKEVLQDAVRSVWREEVGVAPQGNECSSKPRAGADRTQEVMQELEAERRLREAAELRAEKAEMRARAADKRAMDATHLVKEAGLLLQTEVSNSMEQCHQVRALYQEREDQIKAKLVEQHPVKKGIGKNKAVQRSLSGEIWKREFPMTNPIEEHQEDTA